MHITVPDVAALMMLAPLLVARVAAGDTVTVYSAVQGKMVLVPRIRKSEEEWRRILAPLQYRVTVEAGTEPPFDNPYYAVKEQGVYRCVRCGTDLFSSETKYDSGTGWPSFWAPVADRNVALRPEDAARGGRIEVLCARCDAHLGHVFDDGPAPTYRRYCMNSAALELVKTER
jgi:peptide-methionine (R)-S-oxide reductase